MINLEEVFAYIASSDIDTLASLREAIKDRQDKLRYTFKIGQKVWFDAKTRGIIHGTVQKVNAKSIKVLSSTGQVWNVAGLECWWWFEV
jgi:hypothetical protein